MENEIRKFYEFGIFRFDAQARCLRAGGENVQIPPTSLETLGILLENRGDIVTREALLEAVWQGAFVEDANLTVAISTLRKIFAEFGDDQIYIQTLSRKGYRFTGDVKESIELRDAPIIVARHSVEEYSLTADDVNVLVTRKRKYQWPLAAAATLIIAVGVFFAFRNWRAEPAAAAGIRTVAILPFEDIGPEHPDKFLGVGIADSLAKQFGDFRNITVRPIQAVLKYTDRSSDIQSIGHELQVDAVLDGRIQRVGERIRVSLQMVRTSDNSILWTESFDDDFANFFAVQDSISRKVAASLALRLDDSDNRLRGPRGTANLDAYQAYLRGRYFWNKRTGDDLKKAIGHFDEAVNLDPKFALAYTGLADCYQLLAEYGATSPKEAFSKAGDAAQKAVELDPDLAEAYTSLAYTQAFYGWDWPTAERSFRKALELNPNYATAHQWYAEYLVVIGRFDDAEAQLRLALQIDPVSPILMTDLAATYYSEGKFDQAIEQSKKVLEIDPKFAYGFYYLATGYVHKGMDREAVEAFRQMLSNFGEPADSLSEIDQAFAKDGKQGYWKKRMQQIQTLPYLKFTPAFNKAFVFIQMGDRESAMQQLIRSFEDRERLIINIKYSPDFEPLRDDPRFQELVQKMRL